MVSYSIMSMNEARSFCGADDPTISVHSKISAVKNFPPDLQSMAAQLNTMASLCRAENDRWWHDPKTGAKLDRNRGNLIMLMVGELAEAHEGLRKDEMDHHLPNRKAVEVEFADAIIRLLDMAAEDGLDIGGAFAEKTLYNRVRADHSNAARLAPGGKKF